MARIHYHKVTAALYFSNANMAPDRWQVVCKDSDLTLDKVILGLRNRPDLIKICLIWL